MPQHLTSRQFAAEAIRHKTAREAEASAQSFRLRQTLRGLVQVLVLVAALLVLFGNKLPALLAALLAALP